MKMVIMSLSLSLSVPKGGKEKNKQNKNNIRMFQHYSRTAPIRKLKKNEGKKENLYHRVNRNSKLKKKKSKSD